MFSFFTHINQQRQKMEQSKKEMELRHREFADRVRMDIKTGEEELDLKRECFNQRYGHLFSPRNKQQQVYIVVTVYFNGYDFLLREFLDYF